MINFVLCNYDHLFIAGFTNLRNSKCVAIKRISEMIIITAETEIKNNEKRYYFNGIKDTRLKIFLMDYFKEKKIDGAQFAEFEGVYYEMITDDKNALKNARKYYSDIEEKVNNNDEKIIIL